ncbi:MAG: type II secretion system F family protein [Gammaproteobacteria bacterium]|nr:type II secretion system F family protein [Gammaproteobacteria bacterium]
MEFEYEAVDANGRTLKGELEAPSAADVVRRLSQDGQTAVNVSERKPQALPALRRRLRSADVVVAFHELAALLQSGVALGDAVVAQSKGSYHPALAAGFDGIARDLMRGHSFLEAVRGSDLPLPDYVYHLVEAGEMSGRLPQSLREGVDQMTYDQRVASEIRGALTYPAILVLSSIAAVVLVFVFVVPKFSNLLDGDNELPLFSEIVLRTGVWFNDNTWLIVGVAIAAVLALAAALQRKAVRARMLDGLARVPILSSWLSENDTAKWASVMAAMLASRVELIDALDLASRGVRITRRSGMLERAVGDVKGGTALSAALEKQGALTPTGYNLIRVGEQSGQLTEMMRALATLYEENSTRRMKRALALIEPMAILLIGSVLGAIMIAIILAITSVNEAAF